MPYTLHTTSLCAASSEYIAPVILPAPVCFESSASRCASSAISSRFEQPCAGSASTGDVTSLMSDGSRSRRTFSFSSASFFFTAGSILTYGSSAATACGRRPSLQCRWRSRSSTRRATQPSSVRKAASNGV